CANANFSTARRRSRGGGSTIFIAAAFSFIGQLLGAHTIADSNDPSPGGSRTAADCTRVDETQCKPAAPRHRDKEREVRRKTYPKTCHSTVASDGRVDCGHIAIPGRSLQFSNSRTTGQG